MNALAKLILDHLDKAGTFMLPESSILVGLRELTRPISTDMDFGIAFGFLLKKEFIGVELDELSEEKMYYITEAGRVVLLRRNPGKKRE